MKVISRSSRDLGWGLAWTLGYATLYSAWVAFVSGGNLSDRLKGIDQTPLQIIVTYFAIAAVTGPILGFFRPALRFRLGAFLIGSAVGTATYAGVGLSMGYADRGYYVIAALVGIVAGGGLGVVFFDEQRAKATRSSS